MENVIISNPEKFEQIKKQILDRGFKNLHVISDFDRTLTHAFINGGDPVPSLISVLRDEDYLVEGYSDKAKALFKYYHAIEIDSSIAMNDKKKAMEEWWTKHSDLLIESGLNKRDLVKVAKSDRIKFREKILETIILLNEQSVPFVILSASGLGDESVIETLRHHNLYLQNVSVISNKYIWDNCGNAIDYVRPHIHAFNKNEISVRGSHIYELIENRKNIILLGDNLSDIGMVEGFAYENLLKVGFLNSNVEEKLDEYKRNYDVVITNDSSMEFVYSLLKEFQNIVKVSAK